MSNSLDSMIRARAALCLDQPFFGVLAMRLKLQEDRTFPTAWVDGRSIGFNPDFIDSLTHREIVGVVAHEVMHCVLGHPWRRQGRDHKKWNRACDYAANLILSDAEFQLPSGVLLDRKYEGKTSEWIYDRLPEEQGGGQGSGEPQQGGGQDEVRDAPSSAPGEDEEDASEEGWRIATQQAAQGAKARGKLSGSLERFAKEATKPSVDWKAVLRRFVQSVVADDYTWRRPNARYAAQGIYLPSLHSEAVGPIVVAVDTSGSIDDVVLAKFAAEIRAIVQDTKPEKTIVMYCDAAVQRVDEFGRDDEFELHPMGGGGTNFRPVFERVEKLDSDPCCVIYLTDLMGAFPVQAPSMPVLWATIIDGVSVPFGETVLVSD